LSDSFDDVRFHHIHDSAITVLKGQDSLGILDRLVTTNLEGMKNFDLRRALFCDANGRVEDISTIISIEGQILMASSSDSSVQTRGKIIEGTSWNEDCSVIIGDEAIVHLSLIGRKNDDFSELFYDIELLTESSVSEYDNVIISIREYSGRKVIDFLIPTNEIENITSKLREFGSVEKTSDCWEFFRISNGIVSIIDARGNLPSELGLSSLVSISKGCYPGQEIHARLDSRGRKVKSIVKIYCDDILEPGVLKIPEVGNIQVTSNQYYNGKSASLAICRIFEGDKLEFALPGGSSAILKKFPFL